MVALSADDIIRVWETAQRFPTVDRPVSILRIAFPERSPDSFDTLTIGEQQVLLLRLRRALFGSTLDGIAACSKCGEQLEFTVDVESLVDTPDEMGAEGGDLRMDDYALRIRPLRVADLRVAASSDDAARARRLLGERAVVTAARDGAAIEAEQLPERVISRIATELLELDPRAELLLNVSCGACGDVVPTALDAGELLWTEIRARAAQLLREVHLLAAAHGWSERDVLGMSDQRRAAYLALVAG